MTRIERIPEYRIVVPGKAVSFRSPHARDYKKRVRRVARRVIPRAATDSKVEVRIDYFHESKRRFDMDNVAKCVIDALTGIAYEDDKQVRLQDAQAHSLTEVVYLEDGPVDLVKPLVEHNEYLFVRVRQPRVRGRRSRKK